jgi:cell wall-associated NlpC family hydrolase
MMIPGGSYIYAPEGDDFEIGAEKWSLIEPFSLPEVNVEAYKIPQLAAQFLNSPYLWGGKSIMGIDCSGLTQIAFAMGGYQLPRDASQQVEAGYVVDFLTEALPGDLAFFENNEGHIIHVGILLDSSRIIHASGKVRIDIIDSQGIKQTPNGVYTHKLRVIKRIISAR